MQQHVFQHACCRLECTGRTRGGLECHFSATHYMYQQQVGTAIVFGTGVMYQVSLGNVISQIFSGRAL